MGNVGGHGNSVAYVVGGSLLFDDCVVTGNATVRRAVEAFGATFTCTNSSFVRTDNSGGAVGVIYLADTSATIDLCQFTFNPTVIEVVGLSSALTLTRSLLWYNSSPVVKIVAGVAELSQSTFVSGGTFFETGSTALSTTTVHASILSNCLVPPVITPSPPSITFSCSNLFGNAGGDWAGNIADQAHVDGNFSADPLFCDPGRHEFSLHSQSPCLPGHHPDGADCGLIGAFGEGCSTVGVEPESWAAIKSWYR